VHRRKLGAAAGRLAVFFIGGTNLSPLVMPLAQERIGQEEPMCERPDKGEAASDQDASR